MKRETAGPAETMSPEDRARFREAYDDARMRGLCVAGAMEVAAGAIKHKAVIGMAHLQVKRIYDDPADEDGTRILVDRLWPRGVSKEDARLTLWCKDLAPSDELRRWYDHDPQRYEAFAEAYRAELDEAGEAIARLRETIDLRRRVTLLTATRDLAHSHAKVLRDYLEAHL